MKILMVHNYYQQRGGEDSAFEAECALLNGQGHTVERLTFQNRNIRTLPDRILVGLLGVFNPFSFWKAIVAIRRFKPDIMHVHNFFPIASPSIFFAARCMNLPVVATLHNYRLLCANAVLFREGRVCTLCTRQSLPWNAVRFGCYQNSRFRTLALLAMTVLHNWLGTWRNSIDRFIVLSAYQRKQFLDSPLRLCPGKLKTKPNFAPVEAEKLVTAEPEADQRPSFVFVGRLSVEKGIHTLLDAFRQTDLSLKIIGTGPLESLVREVCAESANIEYCGYQDRASVYQYLRNSIALVFPSVLPETFGLSIIEAFSVGTPVVAFALGGPAEIVEHDANGLLIEPGSSAELRKAARRLMDDPALRENLSRSALASYRNHYAPERNHEMLLDIYQELIARKVPCVS